MNAIAPDRQDCSTESAEFIARSIRATCVQLAHDGRESHLNGALSSVDLLLAFHQEWLRFDQENPDDPDRDVFIFSKGHACTSLYAVLAAMGRIPPELLRTYAQEGSALPSHPCIHALPVLDCSSGSLGHGLGVATGRAVGQRLKGSKGRTVAFLSDGECNEGSIWEAAMFAAAQKLENLVACIDANGIQSVGRSDELNGGASLEEKFRAFGWSVESVDGHDLEAIREVLSRLPFGNGRPSALIGRTVAGRGVGRMEDQVLWHYRVPSDEDVAVALKELDAVPLHLRGGSGR